MKKNIPKIQFITQDHALLSHSEQARLAFEKGIDAVQIRMKNYNQDDFLREARIAMKAARQMDKMLIINDSIEITKAVDAHAIHLGLNDIPVNKARQLLGKKIIIGGTANTYADILLQQKLGADYIGLGPFRFTATKKNLSPILGWDGYRKLIQNLQKNQIAIPLIAVGGIQMNEIERFQKIGMHGVALSSALLQTLIQQK